MKEKLAGMMKWTRAVRWLHICSLILFIASGVAFYMELQTYILELIYLAAFGFTLALFVALEAVAHFAISIMMVEELPIE